MTSLPRKPSSVPEYPPAPSGSQAMPYKRDGTFPRAEEKLLDLCSRAVEAKLLYACGQSAPDRTSTDVFATNLKPISAKPWFVKVTPESKAQYFTADDLRKYLNTLLIHK